jgi:hypothetical protein
MLRSDSEQRHILDWRGKSAQDGSGCLNKRARWFCFFASGDRLCATDNPIGFADLSLQFNNRLFDVKSGFPGRTIDIFRSGW